MSSEDRLSPGYDHSVCPGCEGSFDVKVVADRVRHVVATYVDAGVELAHIPVSADRALAEQVLMVRRERTAGRFPSDPYEVDDCYWALIAAHC